MTALLAALAAGAAAAVGHGPRAVPSIPRLRSPGGRRTRRGARMAGLAAMASGAVALCAVVVGGAAAVLVVVLLVAGTTTGMMLTTARRQTQRLRTETEVARACMVLAAEVRSGRPPESAVEVVAVDCTVFGPAAAVLAVGDDPARTWRDQAAVAGCEGLYDLACAWQVSRACGAPMGPSLDQVATALEREGEVGRTVRGELASAQATGRLMAVLPLVGVGLGYAIGGDPVDFLLGSRLGLVCTLTATLLACLGMLWTSALGRLPGRT